MNKRYLIGPLLVMLLVAFLPMDSVGQDAINWVSIEEAEEKAAEDGKKILVDMYTDWCGWCKRLSAAVFNQEEFKEWAAENVILLELDFPKRKQIPEKYRQQNASLQQAFQVRGYPTVWVFELNNNPETGETQINALGKTGYQPTVADFTNGVDKMIAEAGKQGS